MRFDRQCSFAKSELRALDQLREHKLTAEQRQAFHDLYELMTREPPEKEISTKRSTFTEIAKVWYQILEAGQQNFRVPLTMTVAILRAVESSDGEKLLELLKEILNQRERSGGAKIYLFKKKLKSKTKSKEQTEKKNAAFEKAELRAWISTFRFLNPQTGANSFSEQIQNSFNSMLKTARSFCILLRSVVKEIPAYVGYLLLVDSRPWEVQVTEEDEPLTVKDIRDAVLETLRQEESER